MAILPGHSFLTTDYHGTCAIAALFCWRMILAENRYPLFGIMRYSIFAPLALTTGAHFDDFRLDELGELLGRFVGDGMKFRQIAPAIRRVRRGGNRQMGAGRESKQREDAT